MAGQYLMLIKGKAKLKHCTKKRKKIIKEQYGTTQKQYNLHSHFKGRVTIISCSMLSHWGHSHMFILKKSVGAVVQDIHGSTDTPDYLTTDASLVDSP